MWCGPAKSEMPSALTSKLIPGCHRQHRCQAGHHLLQGGYGTIRWYNLDLPDAIAYRQSFIPDSERNLSIAKSFFDTTWSDDIRFTPEESYIPSDSGSVP